VGPENKDVGSIPTIAALARSLGDVAAGAAQAVTRTAGEAISAIGSVVKSAWDGSRPGASAEPALALRAIVGGAAVRVRRKQESGRAQSAPTPLLAPGGFADDDGPLLEAEHDDDVLVVLPRDPRSLFAYWHLGNPGRTRREELLRAGSGLPRDALLVEVEGDGSHDGAADSESWILPLAALAERCHLDLGRPRTRARLSLGLHTEGGGFATLVSAPGLALPRSGPGEPAAPRWRRLPLGGGQPGACPTVPRPEVSDLLAARAGEHGHASSAASPRAQDPVGRRRDTVGGRPD